MLVLVLVLSGTILVRVQVHVVNMPIHRSFHCSVATSTFTFTFTLTIQRQNVTMTVLFILFILTLFIIIVVFIVIDIVVVGCEVVWSSEAGGEGVLWWM